MLLLGLAGCVHYQPLPLDSAARARDFESRRLDDCGLRGFIETNLGHSITNWPGQPWNLETLTLAAYYFNPELEVARAQWRLAEAAALSAGARPNPTVSLAPGYTANSPAGVTPWLMAAGFDWPFETAGKRGLRVTQARHLAAAARFNLLSTAWRVRAEVRDSVTGYRFAESQTSTLGEKVHLQQQLVLKLEERRQAGAMALVEVTPARVALGRMEAELGAACADKTAAAAKLATAIGIPMHLLTNTPMQLMLSTPQLDPSQITAAKQRALWTRSDLLAALAEYDASDTALRLEIAKQYPDVRLSPGYEYDQGANKWRLGLSLELPLLNRNQGPIAEAKARRDETAARFTALQARVISEIDAAAQSWQQSRERYLELMPALNTELKHEQALAAQQAAGAADALDVLSVKLERRNSLALWEDAAYRAAVAFGQLEDATQQLLEVKPEVSAPAPPANLETDPRAPKSKP